MITILCVGKVKENYFRDALKEYQKRLTKYTKLDIIEVPDYQDDKNIALEKEKDALLSKINQKDYIITLEIDGQKLNSLEFSNKIEKLFLITSNITFVIGGSHGLHDEVKKRSNYSLSFSSLTFPHQLFRILLLEQIYRSFKIIHHENYHK